MPVKKHRKLWSATAGDKFMVLKNYFPFIKGQLLEYKGRMVNYDWCSQQQYVKGRAGVFKVLRGPKRGEIRSGRFAAGTLAPYRPRPDGGFKRLIQFADKNGEVLFTMGRGSRVCLK